MRKSIFVAALIVFGGLVYAGVEGDLQEREPDLRPVERALEFLGKGGREGFDLLADQLPESPSDRNWVESQAALHRGHIASLGKACGFELVAADEVGRSLRRYTYLGKYEKGRVRWQFYFYRPAEEWKLNGYQFDSDDRALFSEASHELAIPNHASESVARQPAEPRG